MGPLDRLRVLEIGDRGDVNGKLLADVGAEVIRIEPPNGAATRRMGPFLVARGATTSSQHFALFSTSNCCLSIHEAVSATTEGAFPNWEYFRALVQRQTGRHALSNPPSAPWQYRCSDGAYINLMGGGIPRTVRIWRDLLAWMDETDAAEDLH